MRRACATVASLAALWALVVWWSGGFAVSLPGLSLSSSNPLRPFLVALIAAAVYAGLTGTAGMRADARALRRGLTSVRLAAMLTGAVAVVGIATNSWNVGGPDSYSYMSQADLWLQGTLKVPVPIAAAAPWPNALATFVPLGYRALPHESAIAPMTGPGLPIVMAAFKVGAGHVAAFLVVPLSGALLVWATFLIGQRLGSRPIGLAAAWLVATSPTFLMMFKAQMSDVPAAAAWSLATYWTLGRTLRSAVGAGCAASLAILIRPNLVPIAALLGAWTLLADLKRSPRVFPGRAIAFGLAAFPGCLVIAAINNWLYGSPLSSGYGELSDIFSLSNVPSTLGFYARSFIETQTPVAAAGLVVLLIAPARIFPDGSARAGARLLAWMVVLVWALYAAYPAFGAWWSLRFLLAAWPAMFIGTAAGIVWVCDGRVASRGGLAAAIVVALGIYGLTVANGRHVFSGDGERRYATIAKLVESQTEPSAMILTYMHGGAVRYYGGRATLRFDLLDEAWLDRSVDWLQRQGRHPYALVEDWEMPMFTRRFAERNRLGSLAIAPALAYREAGTIYLFDLLRPDGSTIEPPPVVRPRPLSVPPAVPPSLSAPPRPE